MARMSGGMPCEQRVSHAGPWSPLGSITTFNGSLEQAQIDAIIVAPLQCALKRAPGNNSAAAFDALFVKNPLQIVWVCIDFLLYDHTKFVCSAKPYSQQKIRNQHLPKLQE